MAPPHSVHRRGVSTARQDPGGCRGHKAPIPSVSGDSSRSRPAESRGAPLVSGCGGSQDKHSAIPQRGWQLESDEDFICYSITHVHNPRLVRKKRKCLKACAFAAEHHVPGAGSASLSCCSCGSDALPALLPETLSSGSQSSPGQSDSAGGSAQLSGRGVLPARAMRTRVTPCPRVPTSRTRAPAAK